MQEGFLIGGFVGGNDQGITEEIWPIKWCSYVKYCCDISELYMWYTSLFVYFSELMTLKNMYNWYIIL